MSFQLLELPSIFNLGRISRGPSKSLRQLKLTLSYLPNEWGEEGDEEARLQRPADSDRSCLTWSFYILRFLTYTLESLASASLRGWRESLWELLLWCVQLLDIASPLHVHCYYCLFCCIVKEGWSKAQRKVAPSTASSHSPCGLLSPFMEVEKRMRKPPAFLGSYGTAGNRLASGISIQGWLGGVSAQAQGDWAD